MNLKLLTFCLALILFSCGVKNDSDQDHTIKWSIILNRPGISDVEIMTFYDLPVEAISLKKVVDGITVEANIETINDQLTFGIKASSANNIKCNLTLKAQALNDTAQLYSYQGEVDENLTFRQSPHDPLDHNFKTLVKQDIPMLAVKDGSSYYTAISNTPALYDNYTTQTFDIHKKTVDLSSGDHGRSGGADPNIVKIERYYHKLEAGKPHVFDGIILKSDAIDFNNFRKHILSAIAARWQPKFADRFGATSFSSNYMLLRKNETGNSEYWVVPGIRYANKQYSRDAFWQSMVLPPEYSYQCYLNETNALTIGAERPLFLMIWSYRAKLEGFEPNLEAAEKTLKYIDDHTKDGWYYATAVRKTKNFKSWYDLVEYDDEDVITYNQGLLAVALMAAEALGLEPKNSSEKAITNYQKMFKKDKGYFPTSLKKDLLAVDVFAGDLLAQVYFNRPILSKESVHAHFNTIVSKAKTEYGYKVTSMPNGDYAPLGYYSSEEEKDRWHGEGAYQWGGSWYLYDMLFLLNSYLHNAPGALDEVKWRASLDFRIGGTYYEHIHTKTGVPAKSNQGWNASIYALWNKFIDRGLADDSLLKEIDEIE